MNISPERLVKLEEIAKSLGVSVDHLLNRIIDDAIFNHRQMPTE
jgi:hypothetical protein